MSLAAVLSEAIPLRWAIRTAFGRRVFVRTSEAGVPFRFRPAEYPSLLQGPFHIEADLRLRWIALLRPADRIFDVGANIGLTVHRLFSICRGDCEIVAFEPLPRNLELLRLNVAALRQERVRIVETAVGAQEGTAAFEDNVDHGALSRLEAVADASALALRKRLRTVEVPVTTLDSFIAAHPEAPPAFVKLDVEGAAHLVLMGARQMLALLRPALSCSYHSRQEQDGVVAAVRAAGYVGLSFGAGGIRRCEPEESKGEFL
ncbi:MAG TPA: FkbM family methyltransferase, partial [Myxococcales bacterium]|nr:FkbM family methyltransferase [Myxococcales bacterium]